MKKSIFVILIIAAVMIFVSCDKADVIEIKDIEGNIIEVSTEGMTEEQIDALIKVSSGESNIMELMRSGLFTQQEIAELGLEKRAGLDSAQPGAKREMDFSDIQLKDLNLEGLSEDQISALEEMISGEKTVQEITQSGILTMQELSDTGIIGDMPEGSNQRQVPKN